MKFKTLFCVVALITAILLPITAVADRSPSTGGLPMAAGWGKKSVPLPRFNKSQSEYKVVATYKGNYADTMTAGIAAFRSKNPPHILQVFEVGTASMMAAKGAIKPVYEVMAESGLPFDPNAYLPTVTGYYTTPEGKMLSMPFNSSTPVLYYNMEAFKKPGLDPDKPPKTWPEVAEYAKKLVAAGYPGGFSTAWISWIQLENFSAWHNVPFGTKANGFGGLDTEFIFNSPLHVKHIQQLADWQKDKIFVYGGRRNKGNAKFSSGEVAMYTESSAGYAGFKKTCKFAFGTSMLPYWPEAKAPPRTPSSAAPACGSWQAIRPRSTRAWPPFSTIFPHRRCRPTGISSRAICPSPWRPTT